MSSNSYNLKRGFDINILGDAKKEISNVSSKMFALQPKNFIGMAPIPKVVVSAGDTVVAGDVLFFDKTRPEIKYVAPVSGRVVDVKRGEKRSIQEVIIEADGNFTSKTFPSFDLNNADRNALVNYMTEAGVWAHINERPYDLVASTSVIPKNIFISTFDTAPLAPDLNFIVKGRGDAFQKGLDVLGKLTSGKVHLGVDGRSGHASDSIFSQAKGVDIHSFSGKHPIGNVGVQIHHIAPINANETVWTLGVQDVITIGELFLNGKYNAEKIVALTGAELDNPCYVKTYIGANVGDLLKGNLSKEHVRVVSGDLLSGKKINKNGFLNFRDNQISVIEEGDHYDLFGWLISAQALPTASRSFFSYFSKKKVKVDTNTHGEFRAFVMQGQYEEVLPMDIYVQHLMKAILVKDFERMEGLGIYELTEEDVAICEYVCSSKQPLQKILRQGLDMMRIEG